MKSKGEALDKAKLFMAESSIPELKVYKFRSDNFLKFLQENGLGKKTNVAHMKTFGCKVYI
jgi:hypothetical protein